MSDFNPEGVVTSAKTYARDLAERVASTFVGAFLGGVVITTPLDGSMWYAAGAGGVGAVWSLLKGLAARLKDNKNSASLARGVG
ncbi:hypothetical protein ACFVXE_36810 [Streptomyces sp. NPDC058231]|uniref:hypothetical protein n=1 Tax=Streptomyces sp. NPDC058231 TaxID=3346392 RepID=UPI0036E5DF4E